MGYGGSVMQWHPTLHIAFGYAQTNLRWWDIEDKLAGKLQKAVIDCCVGRALSGTNFHKIILAEFRPNSTDM